MGTQATLPQCPGGRDLSDTSSQALPIFPLQEAPLPLPRVSSNKLRCWLCGGRRVSSQPGLREQRVAGGADPIPGTTPQHTCRIQCQPQLVGVHGSRGVLVKLVECGLGQEVEVSPTPPGSPMHPEEGQSAWVSTPAPFLHDLVPWAIALPRSLCKMGITVTARIGL